MSATTVAAGTKTVASGRLPSALRLGLDRGGIEIKQFFRDKDAVVFLFSFPVILLIVFGSIFSGAVEGTGVSVSQLYVAGMIGSGVMSTSLVSIGIGIAIDRDDGTLKRLYGTPMPRSAYFLGKVVLVLFTCTAEVVLLLLVGTFLYDLELPGSAGRWLTFGWVMLAGMSASALLGIALSSLPRTGRSAPAVINMPFVVLQFISGVFIPFNELPDWLQRVGAVFPLKWMAQGFRSAFLPDSFVVVEPAHGWEHGRTALVLVAWCVGGLVLCLTTFRWKSRRAG